MCVYIYLCLQIILNHCTLGIWFSLSVIFAYLSVPVDISYIESEITIHSSTFVLSATRFMTKSYNVYKENKVNIYQSIKSALTLWSGWHRCENNSLKVNTGCFRPSTFCPVVLKKIKEISQSLSWICWLWGHWWCLTLRYCFCPLC